MGYRVGLSDAAQDDLGTIVRFLAKNNAGAAERLREPKGPCLNS